MNQQADRHLDDEQIIRAVVDETDLSALLRSHLAACSNCRAEKERLSQTLSQLGRMAHDLAPSPSKGVKLPPEKPSVVFGLQIWQWRSLLAAGVVAVLVIAIVWWNRPFTTAPQGQWTQLEDQIKKDEGLMAEVRWLEENALPLTYWDICGECSADVDDEFMEFLIPDLHNDTLSRHAAEEVRYAV